MLNTKPFKGTTPIIGHPLTQYIKAGFLFTERMGIIRSFMDWNITGSLSGNSSWQITQKGPGIYTTSDQTAYINLGNPSTNDLDVGMTDFTIEVLVYFTADKNARFVSKGGYSDAAAGYVLNRRATGTIELECSNGSTRPISANGGSTTNNAWHHVFVVVQRKSGYWVYWDGKLQFNGSVDTSGDNFNSSENLHLGNRSDDSDSLESTFTLFILWKKALTYNEVLLRTANAYGMFEKSNMAKYLYVAAPPGNAMPMAMNTYRQRRI